MARETSAFPVCYCPMWLFTHSHNHEERLLPFVTNNIGPTSVGVNTFSTIVLLILITNSDGGVFLATQHTQVCLILCLILRGGRVALVSPNMRRDMLPWSVGGGGGVTDLPPDAKLCKMQQNRD